MFENRMLRKILGPKSEEDGGGWRKLHAEDLQVDDFYSSLNISFLVLLLAREPALGQGPLIRGVSRSHTTMHHSR